MKSMKYSFSVNIYLLERDFLSFCNALRDLRKKSNCVN